MRDKDNLIREKAILLHEVQHRVANSLQIIASVLMQSARRVQSIEARRPSTHGSTKPRSSWREAPDFNPIENAFSKLKALLRKAAERTIDGLWNRIGELLRGFTPQECANLFAAAGYEPH